MGGLLDLVLGKANPVAQWADSNQPVLGAIGAGLGSGTNFGQGLGNAAQLIPQYRAAAQQYGLQKTAQQAQLDQIQYERQMQQNALGLAAQGRSATADWARSQGYSPAMVSAIQSGAISPGDLFKRTSVAPGSMSVLDLPPDGPAPGAAPQPAPQQVTPPPLQVAPVSGVGIPAAPSGPAPMPMPSPLNPPTVGDRAQQAFASGNVMQGAPSSPVPLAPLPPPQVANASFPAPAPSPAPIAAPAPTMPAAPSMPRGTITNGATNPMDMTPQQRQELGRANGLSGAALVAFTVSGKIPAGLADSIGMGSSDFSAGTPPIPVDPITGTPDPNAQAAFLKTLDPGTAGLVKAVGDYKADLTKVTSLRGDQRAKLAALVQQYNPSFDMAAYPARAAMKKSLASGPLQQTITSVNTTIQHLGELQKAADELHNSDIPIWNTISNTAKSETGQSAPTVFNQTATAVADEAAKVFKGTGATDVGSIRDWRSGLSADSSPPQIKASIQNLVGNLLKARLDTLQQQYKATMGGGVLSDFLTPASRETLGKLGMDPTELDPGSSATADAGSAPDAATVQSLLDKYK